MIIDSVFIRDLLTGNENLKFRTVCNPAVRYHSLRHLLGLSLPHLSVNALNWVLKPLNRNVKVKICYAIHFSVFFILQ